MIKKGIINQLIQTHDVTGLEQHLVYSYLKNNSLPFDKSPILTDYFKGFEQNLQIYFETSVLNIFKGVRQKPLFLENRVIN